MNNLSLPIESVLPSTCRLIHGDCLQVMPTLEAGSVHMVFADLPYAHLKRVVTANKWDVPFDLKSMWQAMGHCRTANAALCFTGIQPFTTALISSNVKDFRYELIWEKDTPTGFLQANKMPLRKHENIVIFYGALPTYNPQKTKGKPYSTNAGRRVGWHTDNNYRRIPLRPRVNLSGDRFPVSVLRLKNNDKRSRLHPTQKPIALLEWLISTYTNEGDTVLDPVFGSNTTAVACARLGRHFVGIEKDPDYFKIGTERVNAERLKLGLQPAEVVS